MQKLNARGVAHDVLVVAFVVVFAVAGIGYLVASHANSCNSNTSTTGGVGPLSCTKPKPAVKLSSAIPARNLNPSGCPDVSRPKQTATSKGRWILHEYSEIYNRGNVNVLLRDHLYTLALNNKSEALYGYCQQGDHGWVYAAMPKDKSLNATALYEYYNLTTLHHYYTAARLNSTSLAALNAESGPGWVAKPTRIVAYVSKGPVDTGPNVTRTIYQAYNPTAHSYYYSGDAAALYSAVHNWGYNPATPVGFYVWDGPSSDSTSVAKSQPFTDTAPVPAPHAPPAGSAAATMVATQNAVFAASQNQH